MYEELIETQEDYVIEAEESIVDAREKSFSRKRLQRRKAAKKNRGGAKKTKIVKEVEGYCGTRAETVAFYKKLRNKRERVRKNSASDDVA